MKKNPSPPGLHTLPESKPEAGVSAARAKAPEGPYLKTALQVAADVDEAEPPGRAAQSGRRGQLFLRSATHESLM
jgi:hypothetical protein